MPKHYRVPTHRLKYPIIKGTAADGSPMELYRVFPRTVTGLWNVTKPVDSPNAPSITYMGDEKPPKEQMTATGEVITSARGMRLPSVNIIWHYKDIPMEHEATQAQMCKIAKELNKRRVSPVSLKAMTKDDRVKFYTEMLNQ